MTAGNKGTAYTLRWPREQSLLGRVFDRSGYSFTIPERDESGFRALSDARGKGVNLVANALAQAVDHVHSFFVMLRMEIGFYVGCLNLTERLAELGEPTTFPVPTRTRRAGLCRPAGSTTCACGSPPPSAWSATTSTPMASHW